MLPDDAVLRARLAAIIANVCRCEPAPLLEDQPFYAVITQFDSLAILEILLEIETEFHIPTDEMLPKDHASGAQEITSAFPGDLSELMAYMRIVAGRLALGPEEGSVAARMALAAERRAAQADGKAARAAAPTVAADPGAAPKD
ncbi:acyl carrier protein [Achromobacter arsenitoxydans]|uniref:Carrier domain-containing protein n=1 Tax=Achromobacter arsenitoxydans SY8 TaxID=477184 RepID=H0F0E8_9BURK|nr:hypothetical protein [Achromobacter arsenitoxydans]EHK68224.1 hypothetical protein KYC_01255 [Achromobacter arsenitoxydans SY8]